MSSTVFSQRNPSPVQTRRNPTRHDGIENNSQRTNNSRSLSGTIRNLFRKNNSSLNRTTNNKTQLSPISSSSSRQRSPSPGINRTIEEEPYLRPPLVSWPFGKKKKSINKSKDSRKPQKTSIPLREISSPIYEQENQSSINGQNYILRTPELTHGTNIRPQSTTNYETTTKGFRDYMFIDHTKPSQQVLVPDIDMISPPPVYTSDHSRSPSLHRQRLPDTNIEYPHYRNVSPTVSYVKTIPTPPTQHKYDHNNSSVTATHILTENVPLNPQTSISSQPLYANESNQWKHTSSSSINNIGLYPTTSSSTIENDISRLNAPLIPYGSVSSNKQFRSIDPQYRTDERYDSSSAVHNLFRTNRVYTNTYGSGLDTEVIQNYDYPGLNAIIEHHIHPSSMYYNERPTTILGSPRTPRFDASTTTADDFNSRTARSTIISNNIPSSPSSIRRHDGYIRPLTPQQSSESPLMYRSSTTVFTKDKNNLHNGGEIRTWNMRERDNIDENKNLSTSFQVSPPIIKHTYDYNTKDDDEKDEYEVTYEYHPHNPYDTQYYSSNRHFESITDNTNSNYPRTSTLYDRDRNYDESVHIYKHTQEGFNGKPPVENSDATIRHYTLKRSDDYDGLGITISADAETHLNHRIRDVEPSSPGYRAGLRKNDRIISVNNINVENIEFSDILTLIKQGLNNNDLRFSVINDSILV